MQHFFERREQERQEMEKYYRTPANLRLKYAALCAIGVAIILFVVMIFLIDSLSPGLMLFMRGCAGLCALIFVALVALLLYRVNTAYWQHRNDPDSNQ